MNLTEEQLNIAICEWRGWKPRLSNLPVERNLWLSPDGTHERVAFGLPSHIIGIEALGNMHAAEKWLTKEQKYLVGGYCDLLEKECGSRELAYFATARQRLIALLRVVKPEVFKP